MKHSLQQGALAGRWSQLRSSAFLPIARNIILETAVVDVVRIEHIRSAHYATYRVYDLRGGDWVVRIGVMSAADEHAADNHGYLDTATVSPTGQGREYQLAHHIARAGGQVIAPSHFAQTEDGYDVMWLPYVSAEYGDISAAQWHQALSSFGKYKPTDELPVFTNRAKTMNRLSQIALPQAGRLREQYDTQLAVLFDTATSWSVVHGDAHGDNAIVGQGQALLFDLDTTCWAPSVWDISHLINRAGQGVNTGYTAEELCGLFSFSDREVAAAVALRQTAAQVAAYYHDTTTISQAS